MTDWTKDHIFRAGPESEELSSVPTDGTLDKYRRQIEPWLSAIFQSEHLSLLVGNGLTRAVANMVEAKSTSMDTHAFAAELADAVNGYAEASAKRSNRGKANIEDQIRAANQLIAGLKVMQDARARDWEKELNSALRTFLHSIQNTEKEIQRGFEGDGGDKAGNILVSFLLSFASRAASRDRLNLFTTNYDRLIEYGCDRAGLRPIDRFVGHLTPVFRASRLPIDMHYNPPGIRGEPRYLEGIVRFTKLHGSVDWRFEHGVLRRYAVPFGAGDDHPDFPKDPTAAMMIYPNAAKDVETSDYPYAELFRDFSAAICRPNSSIVTYGYGFGDDHINRVLRDMLTIPSTHIVIISWDKADGRIQQFCEEHGHEAQISLLIGDHFAGLEVLVDRYLPKPAVDSITWRWAELLERRRVPFSRDDQGGENDAESS